MRLRGLSGFLLLSTACIVQLFWADPAHPDSSLRAGGGSLALEIRGDYLPDFGIEVLQHGQAITTRKQLSFRLEAIEPIGIDAPRGVFEALKSGSGRLTADADLVLRRGNREVIVERIAIIPGENAGHPRLVILDDSDNKLFTLTHLHLALDIDGGRLSISHAELEATDDLARRLGFAKLAGMPIGAARLDLELEIMDRGALSGLPEACEGRPVWPQDGVEADIKLIGMNNVAYQGTHADGRIKLAPSATLKNVSEADIPWIPQFETLDGYIYPDDPSDQHAYLVWNLYRIADGRIEMLAASGAKHAFFTVNNNCDIDCDNNHVVWKGCEDVYAASSNDMPAHQGPRNEIEASIGEWDNCHSFFDPDCTGSQTDYSGQWRHRLLVDPDELQRPGAEYFMDAWYVVQHDVDIWNTMGYLPIDPEPIGNGWEMNEGTFTNGAVISKWVNPDSTGTMSDHEEIVIPSEAPGKQYPENMPQGHLRLLVQVTEVETGRYRYNYALQNYDFDRALEGFRIELPENAEVFDTYFGDIDRDSGNDWRIEVHDAYVSFQAPPGNTLTWFTLFNFEVETDAPPVDSAVRLDLCGEGNDTEQDVAILAPAAGMDLIFEDAFRGSSC
ncbi:hypothetical protein [Wenzhouxiangella sp. EGI_FJ10305]|uniref:hypothetical protein n=1 Tax=Wenzhouxiangella sp. EGI_FJ10305 TaxID=3243768 RepID=UPI0035D7E87E